MAHVQAKQDGGGVFSPVLAQAARKDGELRYTAYYRIWAGGRCLSTLARTAWADAARPTAEVNARAGSRLGPGR